MSKNAIKVEKRETIVSLDANADIQLTQQAPLARRTGGRKLQRNSSSVTQSKFPPKILRSDHFVASSSVTNRKAEPSPSVALTAYNREKINK